MNGLLLNALRNQANYGRSVADVAESVGVELGATPQDPKPVVINPDPSPFTHTKEQRELFIAVAEGLADIFKEDREYINSDKKWEPK